VRKRGAGHDSTQREIGTPRSRTGEPELTTFTSIGTKARLATYLLSGTAVTTSVPWRGLDGIASKTHCRNTEVAGSQRESGHATCA